MKEMLFYLLDKKSGLKFHPMFAANKEVALRTLASEIKDIREKKLYSTIAVFEDSVLMCIEIDEAMASVPEEVQEFRVFFNGVKHEDKNMTK